MRNPLVRPRYLAAAFSLLALAGCDQIDPLTRPYVWVPSDVNVHNIAAQADNPNDLLRGRETPRRRAVMDADAVANLWTGHAAGLLSSTGGPSTATAAAPAPGGG